MKSLAVWFSLLVCAVSLTAQQSAPPAFGEVVEVNVVNLEVYVTGRDGKRVTGLGKEDFQVFEDGKPVAITNFEAVSPVPVTPLIEPPPAAPRAPAPAPPPEPVAEDGINLVVFIDNYFILPGNRARTLKQVSEFLERELRPADRVMIATYDLGLRIRLPFTTDRAAVTAALASLDKAGAWGTQLENNRQTTLEHILSLPDGPCGLQAGAIAGSYAESARQEVLRSISGTLALVNSLSGVPGRKAMLHVSDGVPLTPGEDIFLVIAEICSGSGLTQGFSMSNDIGREGAGGFSGSSALLDAKRYTTANQFNTLAAHANANRVTLYTLQASGLAGPASARADLGPGKSPLQLPTVSFGLAENLRDSLNVLAKETGGRAIFNANDLRGDLAALREDFGSYYSLGYTPAHAGDGREHRIEVKVKGRGLRVRHRLSYRDKPSLEQAVDRTLAALYYGIEDNPLGARLALGAVQAAEGGTYSVPVKLRIPLGNLALAPQGEELAGSFRVLVATHADKGESSPVRQVTVPIRVPRERAKAWLDYTVTLKLAAGEQRLAVAVRDEATALTSFLGRGMRVGGDAGPATGPLTETGK